MIEAIIPRRVHEMMIHLFFQSTEPKSGGVERLWSAKTGGTINSDINCRGFLQNNGQSVQRANLVRQQAE
jgi:hypothetical protein